MTSRPGSVARSGRACPVPGRRPGARAEQSWKIQPRRSGETAMLHRGGCGLYSAQLGFINRQEALIAMNEPDIEACQICKPETGLVDG
ncbi:DUF6233 domain-containing protein [Streptomyces sp. NPDC057908]|uniref:DUF6233 domain-containing protein n=1 Tax=Streptomyces sp. NPDC057908 TaxID=3346276 RepID=UPI0036E0FDE9